MTRAGITLRSVRGSVRERLAAIERSGFEAIEVDRALLADERDPVRLLAAHGLCATALFDDEPDGSTTELARALGTDLVVLPEAAWSRAGRFADDGLRVALLGADDAARHAASLGHAGIGFALDTAAALADGARPVQLRELPIDTMMHAHLRDAPATGAVPLMPGQGDLNLAGAVRLLEQAGYAGRWHLDAQTADGGSPDAVAGDAWRSLITLLDDVERTLPAPTFGLPTLPARVRLGGFEFIEFACDEGAADELTAVLRAMRFRRERQHRTKAVELWRQGGVNIVVNTSREGFVARHHARHGASVCAMGMRVEDADETVARAQRLGTPTFAQPIGDDDIEIPAVRGVGGSLLHFFDEKSELHRVWNIEFDRLDETVQVQPAGIRRIDHLAQSMAFADMQSWLLYYLSTFDMAKSPLVQVRDPSGVVISQALESPEGEVRLNLNGAGSTETFAGSFIADHTGAGVQHIALASDDIFETSGLLHEAGLDRLPIPESYYRDAAETFALDDATVARMREGSILYDRDASGEYFQIYTRSIFGGFFFEIVERRGGYAGYGARNAAVRLASQSTNGMAA